MINNKKNCTVKLAKMQIILAVLFSENRPDENYARDEC